MIATDERVAAELRRGQLIDITTTGRRSGQPRRIELVFHNVDGRILISGRPGRTRDWVANLQADPRMTFHLKGPVRVDLPARGRVVSDPGERRALLPQIAATWSMDLDVMVASSPLVEVTFD